MMYRVVMVMCRVVLRWCGFVSFCSVAVMLRAVLCCNCNSLSCSG